VRHPIYTGLILGTLGWSVWHANLLGVGLAARLRLLRPRPAARIWLMKPIRYEEYRRRAKKLIPFLY
jgi:protein-S-isoprenylcysteine O-methyltransferase Ste14